MKNKLIIILLLLICLTACSKKSERTLNVLNWSSYIPDEVIRDFEKETGIKVNYNTYSSNEELLAKVSGVKEGTYDLIFPSDYMVEILISKNMLERIDVFKVNNYGNINMNYLNLEYDPHNMYTLPFIAASIVITVNKDIVKEDIYSYNQLLNPKYRNEIVLIDDQRSIIGIALMANGFDMNSTNEYELDIAYKWLLELKKNVKAYDSDSPKNFIITEEASIGIMWNAEGSIAALEKPNIENVFAIEGFPISIDNYAIPKGAKNIDELYEFIDYILDAKVMAKIIESYPYKTVNKESEKYLDSTYLNSISSNTPDEIMNKGSFVKNVGSDIKLFDKLWIKLK